MKFKIRQLVRIVDIDRPGIITAAMLDCDGWSYKVAFWDSASRKTEWLFDFEIEEAK